MNMKLAAIAGVGAIVVVAGSAVLIAQQSSTSLVMSTATPARIVAAVTASCPGFVQIVTTDRVRCESRSGYSEFQMTQTDAGTKVTMRDYVNGHIEREPEMLALQKQVLATMGDYLK